MRFITAIDWLDCGDPSVVRLVWFRVLIDDMVIDFFFAGGADPRSGHAEKDGA